jgi:hypothetical protein
MDRKAVPTTRDVAKGVEAIGAGVRAGLEAERQVAALAERVAALEETNAKLVRMMGGEAKITDYVAAMGQRKTKQGVV